MLDDSFIKICDLVCVSHVDCVNLLEYHSDERYLHEGPHAGS